ncbi:MAG: WYL domain-containing protein [Candidatus Latescibacterota bacterium]
MPRKSTFERFRWFHDRVRCMSYPNANTLSAQFQIGQAAAQRDIQFMCERLEAPLQYDSRHHGYVYTDNHYELPAMWFYKNEIIAFVLLRHLVARISDKHLTALLQDFMKKISMHFPATKESDIDKLAKSISLKNSDYFSVDEVIFNKILRALLSETTLKIIYYSPYRDETAERRLVPLHLLNFMGEWYLIAYCGKAHALRGFELSRIQQLAYAGHRLPLPGNLPDIEDYIEKQFGIASGRRAVPVSLRFTPSASKRVKEQVWHPAQKTKWDRQGRLTMTVPVADYLGIKREVLKLGEDVEVIKPAAFRRDIMEELNKMVGLYR